MKRVEKKMCGKKVTVSKGINSFNGAFMGSDFSAFDYVQLINATEINGEIDERIYKFPCALFHSVSLFAIK